MPTAVNTALHTDLRPSPWVKRWSHLLAPRCSVLDVACGQGRHMQWFKERGHAVTGVDRSAPALAQASQWGETVLADIEEGSWPLTAQDKTLEFGAVVVTNYLWRPLLPRIQASLSPGGVLIYETFGIGNETVGKPARPDFLLRTGELLTAFQGLRVVGFEEGFLQTPDRYLQRLVAVRPVPPDEAQAHPPRYPLWVE